MWAAGSTFGLEGTMQKVRRQDRLYPVVLIGFLFALVAVGLLGVPALLVAAGGAVFAALAIVALRRFLEAEEGSIESPATPGPGARQYVPSVLEGSSMRRRRGVPLRRRHRPGQPVRFR